MAAARCPACGGEATGSPAVIRHIFPCALAESERAEPSGVVLSAHYDLARGAFAAGWAETEGELDRDAAFSRWWSALLDRRGEG